MSWVDQCFRTINSLGKKTTKIKHLKTHWFEKKSSWDCCTLASNGCILKWHQNNLMKMKIGSGMDFSLTWHDSTTPTPSQKLHSPWQKPFDRLIWSPNMVWFFVVVLGVYFHPDPRTAAIWEIDSGKEHCNGTWTLWRCISYWRWGYSIATFLGWYFFANTFTIKIYKNHIKSR